MKTDEERKNSLLFGQILAWTLFIALTAVGLISADAKTRYVDSKTEYETVVSLSELFE